MGRRDIQIPLTDEEFEHQKPEEKDLLTDKRWSILAWTIHALRTST